MPRNSRSGSDPGEEIATVFPLRSARLLMSALARTTCGTPGQVQPTILTPVPRTPATIDCRAHVHAIDLTGQEGLHQRGAGFDLQNFKFQAALGSKTAFVDHRDEARIALGFEDAMLPNLFLRVSGRDTAKKPNRENWQFRRRKHESSNITCAAGNPVCSCE